MIALALAAMPLALSDAAEAADALLSGAIASSTGEKLGGVTVSAKAAGQTITTTVFTDETGKYYFPPLPTGTYRVWAQTLSFATAKSEVDLSANRRQDFTLVPLKEFVQQLPGDLVLASLPDATPEDRRMKALVSNNCSGCHTPSFTLQQRFDEAGWTAIVDLMKRVNVSGVYGDPEHKPQGVLDRHQQELAAYLARARGPTESMTIKLRPRPSGETARVVFKEYDVPLAPELNVVGSVSDDRRQRLVARHADRASRVISSMTPRPISTAISGSHRTCPTATPRLAASIPRPVRSSVQGERARWAAANTHGMTRDAERQSSGSTSTPVPSRRLGASRSENRKDRRLIPPAGMSPTRAARSPSI